MTDREYLQCLIDRRTPPLWRMTPLAKAIGVNRQSLRKWLRGDTLKLHPYNAAKVAAWCKRQRSN